jgi:hypothetical protein
VSAANSPYYSAGLADGGRDAAEVKAGREPLGEDGARSWSGMYRDGYRDGFADPDATSSADPGDAGNPADSFEVDMSPIYAS